MNAPMPSLVPEVFAVSEHPPPTVMHSETLTAVAGTALATPTVTVWASTRLVFGVTVIVAAACAGTAAITAHTAVTATITAALRNGSLCITAPPVRSPLPVSGTLTDRVRHTARCSPA